MRERLTAAHQPAAMEMSSCPQLLTTTRVHAAVITLLPSWDHQLWNFLFLLRAHVTLRCHSHSSEGRRANVYAAAVFILS